jgi:hypothetical protein
MDFRMYCPISCFNQLEFDHYLVICVFLAFQQSPQPHRDWFQALLALLPVSQSA